MLSNAFLEDDEHDLLFHWFINIGNKRNEYKEPILDPNSVKLFKQISESLEQTSYVFVLSVEVAEAYIQAKNVKNEEIKDPFLSSVVITFICHKCEGAPESLKLRHLQDVLFYFTGRLYDCRKIAKMESEILLTLEGKLPITSTLDDLDIVIERYIRESRLRANVRPLCLNILEFVYIERSVWFTSLKETYSQNESCFSAFQALISSKFYLPVSVLIVALQLTNYRHILDFETILGDISKCTNIHEDHLNVLAAKIIEILN